MRLLLTTIVDNANFGTFLQAYATAKKFQDFGCDVTVLNYVRDYLKEPFLIDFKRKDRKFIVNCIHCFYHNIIVKHISHRIKSFLLDNCKHTKEYSDVNEINKIAKEYDLFLVGSDQVWNNYYNRGIDEVFFLKGIIGYKSSYASSIGANGFPEEDKVEVAKLLSQFKHISVREDSAVKILNSYGINNVEHVLDPTLLLTGNEWKTFSKKSNFKKNEPYLLIYSVENERYDDIYKVARKIADEKGFKIYMISSYYRRKKKYKVDKMFSFASIYDFLSLMSQADFVVVSSFHGTAFSINFNRQFVTISPSKYNSRVMSLLRATGLEKRYMDSINQMPKDNINYLLVNEKLQDMRIKSEKFIEKVCSDC